MFRSYAWLTELSGHRFPRLVEHSAAERHAGAVADCWRETSEDSSIQSLYVFTPCGADAIVTSDTITTIFSFYHTYSPPPALPLRERATAFPPIYAPRWTLAHWKRNWTRFYFTRFIQFPIQILFCCIVTGLVGHCCKPQPSFIIIITYVPPRVVIVTLYTCGYMAAITSHLWRRSSHQVVTQFLWVRYNDNRK